MELNDAPILDQVREHWQKLLAIVVWKLAPQGVTITHQDLVRFYADSAKKNLTLLTHGHRDSIDFKMVTREEAEQIAAHDAKTNRGRA